MQAKPFVKPEYLYRVRVNGVITQTSMDSFSIRSHWIYQSKINPDAHVVMEDVGGKVYEDNQACPLCHQPIVKKTLQHEYMSVRPDVQAKMDALVQYLVDRGLTKEQTIYTLALMNEYDAAWNESEDNEQ